MKLQLFAGVMMASVCMASLIASPAQAGTYADPASSVSAVGMHYDNLVSMRNCRKGNRVMAGKEYLGCKTGSVLAQAESAAATTAYPANDAVILAEWTKRCVAANSADCDVPRSARPSTIAGDSPVVPHGEFLKRYPQAGEAGYQRIRTDNHSLCDEAHEYMAGINDLDKLFKITDDEYNVLSGVYNSLPTEVRRTTRVMQVTQAVQAGLLCLLSAGTYCIAVSVGAGGNIITAETNRNLQLANIRLSIANILLTKLNIWSNRLTLRLDGLWLKDFVPACHNLGYDTLSGLPPLPELPKVPEDFGKPDTKWHW